MSDMTACLNDLSYIPLNNEQNEPTQGDIGETSNDPTQAKRNEFEELYASANEELYPGCDYVTRLDFMAMFTFFKINLDIDDGVNVMSAHVARGHGGDDEGDDRPPPYQIPTGCRGCLGNRGHPKTQFGWQESGQAEYPPGDLEPRDEMVRLQGLGSNTETGVPYTEDEIMAIVHGGKQQGHIPGMLTQLGGSGCGGCGDDEPGDDEDGDEDREDEDDS
ncbi:hypothetical protein Tco_1141451 [Tanacetum coccineum]